MRIWCIKIGTVYDLYYDPWVEASTGGLLVPEGLYNPVAMYYVTTCSLKYGYVLNCNSGKIRNSYQNKGLSPSGIALILLSIWLQSLALHCSLL